MRAKAASDGVAKAEGAVAATSAIIPAGTTELDRVSETLPNGLAEDAGEECDISDDDDDDTSSALSFRDCPHLQRRGAEQQGERLLGPALPRGRGAAPGCLEGPENSRSFSGHDQSRRRRKVGTKNGRGGGGGEAAKEALRFPW